MGNIMKDNTLSYEINIKLQENVESVYVYETIGLNFSTRHIFMTINMENSKNHTITYEPPRDELNIRNLIHDFNKTFDYGTKIKITDVDSGLSQDFIVPIDFRTSYFGNVEVT